MNLRKIFLVSFFLTAALEEGIGWLLGIRGRRNRRLIFLVNLLTNPAVVFLYYANALYGGWSAGGVVLFLEGAAIAAEGFCYQKASENMGHPWLYSLVLNLCSYGAGRFISG